MFKYSRVITLVGVVICLALNAAAQKNIEKPFETWSKEDALKILSDSPWAKVYQHDQPNSSLSDAPNSRATGANTPASQGSRDATIPSVLIRLHSARPIREAVVRLQQIESGYDKKSDAEKEAYSATQKNFLDCAICSDYYVITIFKAPSRGNPEGMLGGMTAEALKPNVKLMNDKGEEREIAQFEAPKNAREPAVLYFKRVDDKGTPLLTEDSKELRLVFTKEFLVSKNLTPMLPAINSFKVAKMVVGGKLLF